jgi:hypothetical protein
MQQPVWNNNNNCCNARITSCRLLHAKGCNEVKGNNIGVSCWFIHSCSMWTCQFLSTKLCEKHAGSIYVNQTNSMKQQHNTTQHNMSCCCCCCCFVEIHWALLVKICTLHWEQYWMRITGDGSGYTLLTTPAGSIFLPDTNMKQQQNLLQWKNLLHPSCKLLW